jgi:hypothetical protein
MKTIPKYQQDFWRAFQNFVRSLPVTTGAGQVARQAFFVPVEALRFNGVDGGTIRGAIAEGGGLIPLDSVVLAKRNAWATVCQGSREPTEEEVNREILRARARILSNFAVEFGPTTLELEG